MIMIFSPGMFHASAALLPSSFAMYASMLGLTAFMDWRGGLKTARGIMWFGIGALVGWPFAGALAAPFLLEEMIIAIISRDIQPTVYRFIDGMTRCLLILVGNRPGISPRAC
jgi:alpha-1,2-mannosyltransferase